MAGYFWFSDSQWARISPLLPVNGKGARRVDDRRVLSGIVYALQSGGRWGDCPEHVYGPNKTLYNRFVRWAERGVATSRITTRRVGYVSFTIRPNGGSLWIACSLG